MDCPDCGSTLIVKGLLGWWCPSCRGRFEHEDLEDNGMNDRRPDEDDDDVYPLLFDDPDEEEEHLRLRNAYMVHLTDQIDAERDETMELEGIRRSDLNYDWHEDDDY